MNHQILCPNCKNQLTFDPGEPGDFYGPPVLALWGCDNCGADYPEYPPPDADMGDRLQIDELRRAALNRGRP